MEKGKTMEFEYEFDETKYLIEGELNIETTAGQKFIARAGDILYFPRGCGATFSSDSYGLAFYVSALTCLNHSAIMGRLLTSHCSGSAPNDRVSHRSNLLPDCRCLARMFSAGTRETTIVWTMDVVALTAEKC